MKKTAIIFGSTTDNTKNVAEMIAEKLGNENITLINASELKSEKLDDYDNLILGTSTWGLGDLQDDWESALPILQSVDLSAKTIAFFGLGDSSSYSDTFVDGMGVLYEEIVDKGAQFIGCFPTDGYNYDASRAEIDGKFVGVALDEDNEAKLTNQRLDRWIESIKTSLS